MLADSEAAEADWLIALEQEAGKGRQGRTWVSARGNFSGSTLVIVGPNDPPAPALSLAAGLALVEAIDVAVPGQALMLKWPNDVMLLGRKLAGILLERAGGRVVVGFGINLSTAPTLTDGQAATLGGQIAPEAFAPLLAGNFSRMLEVWRSSKPSLLAQAWLVRAHPIGTRITVHSTRDERVSGRFDGLEPDGALRLRRDDGDLDIIRAGDVEL